MRCEKCGKNFKPKLLSQKFCRKCLFRQGIKYCPQCKQFKSTEKFGKDRAKGYGYCSECKECRSRQGRKNTLGRKKYCETCGKELTGMPNIRFCKECKEKRYKKQIKNHRPIYYGLIEAEYNIILPRNIIIHHIDGNHKNNNLENLYIFKSQSAHSSYHNRILTKWALKFPMMSFTEAQKTYPKLVSNLENFRKK